MDLKKKVEASLRNYKTNISKIETTLLRIETYKEALDNPDLHDGLFLGKSKEPGMPRSNNFFTSSVEDEVLTLEEQNKILKQWIKDDKSRIYPLQIEVEHVKMALAALSDSERYIIECKYFENMFWRDIEVKYNDKYRTKNYITYEGLKRVNKDILENLCNILSPYYFRFNNTITQINKIHENDRKKTD